jgi:hypothetical protein
VFRRGCSRDAPLLIVGRRAGVGSEAIRHGAEPWVGGVMWRQFAGTNQRPPPRQHPNGTGMANGAGAQRMAASGTTFAGETKAPEGRMPGRVGSPSRPKIQARMRRFKKCVASRQNRSNHRGFGTPNGSPPLREAPGAADDLAANLCL